MTRSSVPRTDREPVDAPERDGAEATAHGVDGFDRLRMLVAVAMGTVLLSYALLVPVAAAVVAAGGGAFSLDGAFAAAIPLWLAAHQIPLLLQDQPLSVFPLLPTAGVVVVIAWTAAWTVWRLGHEGSRNDTGAVVAAITGAHAAAAVLGSALLPRSTEVAVAPWAAMLGGGVVAGAAAAVGVARGRGFVAGQRGPGWLRPALHASAVAVTGLVGIGALLLTVAMAVRAAPMAAAYAALAPDLGAGIGVTLLALAYLPNAMIAALSWALGPGVTVGAATASPLITASAAPSSFPLLAALPEQQPPAYALAVFALPLTVGVLTGIVSRRAAPVQHRFAAGLATVALTVIVVAVLALLAGGRLATGPFDPVRVPAALLVPATLLWIGVPVMFLAVIGAPAADGPRGPARRPATEDDAASAPRTVGELVALRAEHDAERESGDEPDAS